MSLQKEITCYKIAFFTLLLIESVLPNFSSFLQFFPYSLSKYFHTISQEGTKTEAYCTYCYLAPQYSIVVVVVEMNFNHLEIWGETTTAN